MKHLSLIMSMLAAFSLALSGCTESETARSLDRAEAVMEEHPDSALAILGAIPSADVNSSADRALHALLLIQAQIKNGHIVDNDSLINIAVRHYSDRDDSPRLMKSLFYKAQVEYNRGDMTAAIVPAIRARELATEFDDSYWRAKAAELISDICSDSYYEEESVKYTEEAVEHYKKAGKTRNHLFALCDLATVRSNHGVDDNINITLLDSVRRIAIKEPADTTLIVYADRTLLEMYVDLGKNTEAGKTLKELFSLNGHFSPNIRQYAYIARLALNNGDEEEALQIIKMGDSEESLASQKVSAYRFYRDYHKSKGMSREAEAYTDSILTLQNMEVAAVLKQSVVSAQRDFFTARAEKEADKARLSAMTASALGILLAAVCIGFLLYYREKMRRKKAEIETMMLEAQSLSAQLDEKDESLQSAINELNKTRNDLKELSITVSDKDSLLKTQTLLTNSILEKRFQTLNALSKDYFTLTNQSSPRTGIVSDFKKELDIMANPESQAELERIVNNKHQGIITRLRNQLPKIKDQDIFFLTLIAAGVSRNAICLITKNKQANYYNKCSRLRRKIENSDSTDKQEFLDTIFK